MNRRRFGFAVAVGALAPGLAAAQTAQPDQARYLGEVSVLSQMMGWFYQESSRLSTNATTADYADEKWRVEFLGSFAVPQAAQATVATMSPPPAYVATHGHLVDAIDDAVRAGDAMRQGILGNDAAAIQTAVGDLQQSNTAIKAAVTSLPSG